MKTYEVKSVRGNAFEAEGHGLSIDFSPQSPTFHCPEHSGLYLDLNADGSKIWGEISGHPDLRFTAKLEGTRVHCTLYKDNGSANEVGSWTAEEGGKGDGEG